MQNRAVLGPDSPLRHLPIALNARQAMYCDGVRYAIEMLDRSYSRLISELEAAASNGTTEECPAIFLDAWSVVDSANRLRILSLAWPVYDPLARAYAREAGSRRPQVRRTS